MPDETGAVSADLKVLATKFDHLATDTRDSGQKIEKIDERVRKLEMAVYLAVGIAVVFGAAGAFGFYALSSARKQIDTLGESTKALERRQLSLGADLGVALSKVGNATIEAEKSISMAKSNAIGETHTTYNTIVANIKALTENAERDLLRRSDEKMKMLDGAGRDFLVEYEERKRKLVEIGAAAAELHTINKDFAHGRGTADILTIGPFDDDKIAIITLGSKLTKANESNSFIQIGLKITPSPPVPCAEVLANSSGSNTTIPLSCVVRLPSNERYTMSVSLEPPYPVEAGSAPLI